jgi:DNA-binding MarR family transcriptional regulator
MNTIELYKIRAELTQLGVPTKSIPLLQAINKTPGITTTELGALTGMSKQAASKHVRPLEETGILTTNHPHPLYKSWDIADTRVRELISQIKES